MDSGSLDLVLDVGNTLTKLAVFQGDRVLDRRTVTTGDLAAVVDALGSMRPSRIAVGSVSDPDEPLLEHLRSLAPILVISGTTATPLRSAYTTLGTLGVDRLANAVGAAAMFPGRTVLAVDMGTCITYDLVDEDGTYVGGAIAPGARMRAKAMHAYSARLPEVEVRGTPVPWGTSTDGSLQAGIHHGILGELQGFIHKARHRSANCAVVLTGGDALLFARACKSGIFAHPFLTLEGLRRILHHHTAGLGPVGGSPV